MREQLGVMNAFTGITSSNTASWSIHTPAVPCYMGDFQLQIEGHTESGPPEFAKLWWDLHILRDGQQIPVRPNIPGFIITETGDNTILYGIHLFNRTHDVTNGYYYSDVDSVKQYSGQTLQLQAGDTLHFVAATFGPIGLDLSVTVFYQWATNPHEIEHRKDFI